MSASWQTQSDADGTKNGPKAWQKMEIWGWLTHRTVGEEHVILSGGWGLGYSWDSVAAPLQWCLAGAMAQAFERQGWRGRLSASRTAETTGSG